MTFREFCKPYGDIASVLGLLVSLVGFVITIFAVVSAKKAAQQAAIAAKQAKDKILKQGSLANFSTAISVMEDIIRLYRKKEWQIALDRHSELRRMLVELKDGSAGLTRDQQTLIQSAVEQFNGIESMVEKTVSGKPEPNVARINGVVKDQILKVHEIAISLKNN